MSKPVSRLCIYRPKPGHEASLEAVAPQHGAVLRKTGLITSEPVRLYRARDIVRGGAAAPSYLIETFQWRDDQSAELAHQTPEVMAVWETMGPHLEQMTLTTLEAVN